MNNKLKFGLVAGASSAVSLVAGAYAGYFAASRRLEERFEQELIETKAFYAYQNKYLTPQDAAAELILETEAAISLSEYLGEEVPVPTGKVDKKQLGDISIPVARNIFQKEAPSAEEWAQIVNARDKGRPYIISQDEFLSVESGFEQVVITYYQNGVITGENDEPLDAGDVSSLFEEDHLRFGYMSNEENVVYVRNNKLGMEFEIHRVDEEYDSTPDT